MDGKKARGRGARASFSPHHIPLRPLFSSPTTHRSQDDANPISLSLSLSLSLINGTDFVRETEQDKERKGLTRHFLDLIHLCCGMDEANTEGTRQASIAPAPSELPESPVASSSEAGHSEQRTEQDETTQEGNSSYKASEIAGRFIQVIDPKPHVDTAAPIDSVKGAVSKFGGILDWRERRKEIQDELDKVHVEVAKYQKWSQEAEAGKARALQELESTAKAADELTQSVEKAQTAESQARQDTELAELRLRELQRGASESAAAKAELDAFRDRRDAALAELQSARAEVASLEKQRAAAAGEADAVAERALVAAAASREAAKAAAGLAAEVVALKRELESSHAAHGEAEEKRMALAAAFERDKARWQSELEEGEVEAKRLREELMAACDVEIKAESAAELLANLKAELLACTVIDGTTAPEKPSSDNAMMRLEKARKELEEVKESIGKAKGEAYHLRFAAVSMRDDLERQKAELAALQRKEALSAASIPSLEEELKQVTSSEAEARGGNDEVHDEGKMAEQVDEARREAEQAKEKARSAREEMDKATEEAAVAKAAVAAVEARLEAVTREILAAHTAEETATASANALMQTETLSEKQSHQGVEEGGVTLSVEEYEELSRRARETEEAAGKRVMEAVKQIKEAKDAEVRSLEKLAKVGRQTEQRRQALLAATEEAEEAEFAKLSAERELRQWRADHHQGSSSRTGLAEISALDDPAQGNPHILSPRGGYMPRPDAAMVPAAEADAKQRKTTLFPRMVMFLARKKAQTWK
ncbi:hypothetical protein EJB05_52824, partial [Eragrostis curvula]